MPKRHVSMRLTGEGLDYLAGLGELADRSLSWMVDQAISEWVQWHRASGGHPLPPTLDLARKGVEMGPAHTPLPQNIPKP